MSNKESLRRFIDAQEHDFNTALNEIKSGSKRSHWMWYIFPQIAGLGYSEIARHYAIADLAEAKSYLDHPVLGQRLMEISSALLSLSTNDALQVMGSPDDLKLKSSMTLFALISGPDSVFEAVLDKFYKGEKDNATLNLLK